MSRSFVVYRHPVRGCWGYALPGDGPAETAAINAEGKLTLATEGRVTLAARIQEKVRQGYAQQAQAKYLASRVDGGVLKGDFVSSHPDLVTDHLAGEQLFFVALRTGLDLPEVAEQLRQKLDGTPGRGQERNGWLTHVGRVTTYLPVLNAQQPCEALAVAEWARNNNMALVAAVQKALPDGLPSQRRHPWRAYLANWWGAPDINEAFSAMRWPLHEALAATPPSATSTTEADADWFTNAQHFAF
jgi:hypothetical protein